MTLEENFLNFSENNESNPSVKMQILHEGVNPKGTSFSKEAIEEANKLLEKEKEQIKNSYLDGDGNGCGCYDFLTNEDAEQYYNETYK